MNSNVAKIGVMAALLLALGSYGSCSSRPNLVIHQSDALSVVLRELPAGYPSLEPHNHPYKLSSQKALDILGSLDYSQGSFFPFSQERPQRVFSRRQAESLAPELSKALSMALPQEVAAFSLADEEKPDRRTRGLGFVQEDELHVIIEELRKPFYEGEQKSYQQQVPRWELIPRDRQRHYTTSPDGKGVLPNWVVIPLR
jgi:hypothetical protein